MLSTIINYQLLFNDRTRFYQVTAVTVPTGTTKWRRGSRGRRIPRVPTGYRYKMVLIFDRELCSSSDPVPRTRFAAVHLQRSYRAMPAEPDFGSQITLIGTGVIGFPGAR